MDQQQLEIALEIINLDCQIVGQLNDGEGGFCASGGLIPAIDPACARDADSSRSE